MKLCKTKLEWSPPKTCMPLYSFCIVVSTTNTLEEVWVDDHTENINSSTPESSSGGCFKNIFHVLLFSN